jgi:hypothetical protein
MPMALQEEVLLKVLEHKRVAEGDLYRLVCSVLGLQYFAEQNTHTLSAMSFITDIFGSTVKITFVDEWYNNHFRYVEFYLSDCIRRRDYTRFYYYLRMFTRLENGNSELVEANTGGECSCVTTGAYCIDPSLDAIASCGSDAIYNIYTHRLEYHMYLSGFLLPIPASGSAACEVVTATNLYGDSVEAQLGLNLAGLLGAEDMYGEILHLLPSPSFYWKANVGGAEVAVDGRLDIRVDGRLDRKASFLLKSGRSLFFSLVYFGDVCRV